MRQVPEAEGHARDFRFTRRIHDFLVKVRAKFFRCFLLREGHAVSQQIRDLLIHRQAKEPAGQLMVCRPHIRVGTALHIVDDLFIAINGRIQAVVIFLSIRRHLICVGFTMRVDRTADKLHPRLFVLAHRHKVIICLNLRSPLISEWKHNRSCRVCSTTALRCWPRCPARHHAPRSRCNRKSGRYTHHPYRPQKPHCAIPP